MNTHHQNTPNSAYHEHDASKVDPDKHEDHQKYMLLALRQAKKAFALGEVPIGCIIVYNGTSNTIKADPGKNIDQKHMADLYPGKIIGRGYNRRNTDRSSLSHAEITAIKKAGKAIGDWRLEHCTLYVTLEPCQMCAGAIVQARIPNVVMGTMNPKAGCGGSILNLLEMPAFN
ncbi:MAG: nucleoside deaminase, partial [Lachnospiraceae bacterium]|nr:nucleoside deaminase [Lachnospiraceae bacterium]